MRAAIIENGVVVNLVVVADAEFAVEMGWIITDTARIGDIYDSETDSFSSPRPAVTRANLKEQLIAQHNRSCAGRTPYMGINISIDTEARINAEGTLAKVRDGKKAPPFPWFSGDEYVMVESVDDMQALDDAIFDALDRRFQAKGSVLAAIDGLGDGKVDGYDVEAEYMAIAEPDVALRGDGDHVVLYP